MTEDERAGWHHQLNGHEFEPTLGDDEGQGSLAYCSSWGRRESDTTEQLNNKKNHQVQTKYVIYFIFEFTIFGSKQEKEYVKAVYCHPVYFTSMQSTS